MGRARDEMIVRPDWVLFKDIVQRTLEAGARLGGVADPLALGEGCVSGNPLGSMGDEVQFTGSTGMGPGLLHEIPFRQMFVVNHLFARSLDIFFSGNSASASTRGPLRSALADHQHFLIFFISGLFSR